MMFVYYITVLLYYFVLVTWPLYGGATYVPVYINKQIGTRQIILVPAVIGVWCVSLPSQGWPSTQQVMGPGTDRSLMVMSASMSCGK